MINQISPQIIARDHDREPFGPNPLPESETLVPRPLGLPLDQGFVLKPLDDDLSFLATGMSEGQLVVVDWPMTEDSSNMPLGYLDIRGGSFNQSFQGLGPSPVLTMGLSGEHLAMVNWPLSMGDLSNVTLDYKQSGLGSFFTGGTFQGLNQHLWTTGFGQAGPHAVGVIAIPSTKNLWLESVPQTGKMPQWQTRLPQTLDTWGHTATYARVNGRIVKVRGFSISYSDALKMTFAKVKTVPGLIENDRALFTKTNALVWEVAGDMDDVAAFVKNMPEPGSIEINYSLGKFGDNCATWAGKQVEIIDDAFGAIKTKNQHKVIQTIHDLAELNKLPDKYNLPEMQHAGGMPKQLKLLKWGGRVFLVLDIATIPVEVALAEEDQRVKTAIGSTGGFLGGMALAAGASLLCGPGAPICFIITGAVLGFTGYHLGRGTAEGVYNEATDEGSFFDYFSDIAKWLEQHAPEDQGPRYVCFTGETPVWTAGGEQLPIAALKPGQAVKGYDAAEDDVGDFPITRVMRHQADLILELALEGGDSLRVTPSHPMKTDTGWTPAGALKPGDAVWGRDGACGVRAKVRVKAVTKQSGAFTVYNLTVGESHTYFARNLLVHNK